MDFLTDALSSMKEKKLKEEINRLLSISSNGINRLRQLAWLIQNWVL